MARPREFDREEALHKALDVFWLRGYAATSMSDLQRALGIGRQSLYNTFRGKHEIFVEALTLYLRRNRQMVDRLLVADQGVAAVDAYLMATATNVGARPNRACFLFNTCVELGPHDAEIRAQLQDALMGMRRGFARCLAHAKATGTLGSAADPERLAIFLTAQVGGITALARSGASVEELQAVAAGAMRAFQ